MDKYEAAQTLRDMAFFIALSDPVPEKSFAYRKAATAIEECENFYDLLEKNALRDIPGVGYAISGIVKSLMKDRIPEYLNQLKSRVPEALLEMSYVGLSTTKIRYLYENFGIGSLHDLLKVLEEKKITGKKGFGPSFLAKLEQRIQRYLLQGLSLLFPKAERIATILKNKLESQTNRIEICGSLRRKCETVDEIVIVAVTDEPGLCGKLFLRHGFVREILRAELPDLKVVLKQGIPATFRIVSESEYCLSLIRSTGNDLHWKGLQKKARQKQVSLDFTQFSFCEEKEVYERLGLHFIPPELREGYGEIQAAGSSDFSDLIEEQDLKGTFHCHTSDSDGMHTLQEMSEAAQKMGWQYIGISDHSKSSYFARGLQEDRLLAQIASIEEINKKTGRFFRVFAGTECDILKDGTLDFSDEILKKLDFVIVSVHSLFKLEKDLMTKRIIKAIEHPYTTMVGHLTGRLLGIRDPYQIDIPKIVDACIANEKIIELNSYPSRLDMDWRFWIGAAERGLRCSINPDAHSIYDLGNCRFGVNMARKGRLKKQDVINTLDREEMIKYLMNKKY